MQYTHQSNRLDGRVVMQRPAKPFTPVRFRIQPPLVMKIGIIGFGFVGEALANGLNDDVEICKIDPKLSTSLKDLKEFSPKASFICLPTPMSNDGSQDIEIIKNTLLEIKNLDIGGLVIIKSTVNPKNITELQSIYSDFIYNPEFLREKYAKEDFINSDLIVFGGKSSLINKASNIYKNYTKCKNKDYIYTDAISASLIKYSLNSFLATKVIFFNELNNLFEVSGAEETWENFIDYISKDKRIGNSHMMVPGHDGRFGFGGACFPKDTSALLKYAELLDIDLTVLKSAILTNNKIRASYNSNTHRENEQNVTYNNKEEK